MKPDVTPIYNEKALVINDHLVVADLHLGIEHELEEKGTKIPPQAGPMTERIINLLAASGAGHLVILGDLKHNIPQISWQEYSQVPAMVKTLSDYADVTVIKGNHDGNIEKLLPDTPVLKTLEIGDSLLLHGHARIPEKKFDRIIAGHNHPSVELRDEFKSTRESAWVRSRLTYSPGGAETAPEVIVIPAFNDLLQGAPVNTKRGLVGPVLGKIDVTRADAYLLDGTHLRIKDILH